MAQALRSAAWDRLDADVPPVDLSKYEQTPDAGVLAGATGRTDARGEAGPDHATRLAPGAGPTAAARVAELKGAVTEAGTATAQLSTEPLGELFTDLLEIGERTERAQVFALADAIDRGIIDASDAGSPGSGLPTRHHASNPGRPPGS